MVTKGTPYLGNGKDSYSKSDFIKCKKCGHEYYRTWEFCPECRTKTGSNIINFLPWIVTIVMFIFIGFIFINLPDSKTNIAVSQPSSEEINLTTEQNPIPQTNSFKAEPFPPTGIYKLFTNDDLLAPFQIRNHTDNYSYLLKFVNTNDDSIALTIFINKNENCDLKVPLGTYEILTAYGDTWYGDQELFGPSTNYKKYENIFEFYKDELQIHGYYIDFSLVSNGNLKSDYITKDDFI